MDTGIRETSERYAPVVLIAMSVATILLMAVVPVAAQETFSDDFEDGNIDGWTGSDGYIGISEGTHPTGESYVLKMEDGFDGHEGRAVWESGPTLDLNQQFKIEFVSYSNLGDSGANPIRYGIIDDNNSGAAIIFDPRDDVTWVGDPHSGEVPNETINTDFRNTWVNVRLESSGDGSLSATVWEVGSEEPSSPQISNSFEGESGKFSINPGVSEYNRIARLDYVTMEGVEIEESEDLRLDADEYQPPGTDRPYAVEERTGDTWTDVTSDASVTSSNSSVLAVDSTEERLVSDENVSTAQTVQVTAEYNGMSNSTNVTVAPPTVANLDHMPIWWKVTAVFSDSTIFWALVATAISVAAARVVSMFAGLGAYQIVMTLGWIMGEVHQGTVIACLFVTLFIGLNVSENLRPRIR